MDISVAFSERKREHPQTRWVGYKYDMTSRSNTTGSVPAPNDLFNSALFSSIGSTVKSKWDSSSGPQMLSSMGSRLPAHIQTQTSSLASKYLSVKYLRSPTVYFGVGEEKPFFLLLSFPLLYARLRANLQYFYLNYLLLACVLFCATLMISPSSIISLGLLAFLWFYALQSVSGPTPLVVAGYPVPPKVVVGSLALLTAFLLTYVLASVFTWTLWTTAFCVGAHSGLRDGTMLREEENVVQMEGELEDAPFLNEGGTGRDKEGEGNV